MFKAVLFDLDGVILDSVETHLSYMSHCANLVGVSFFDSLKDFLVGDGYKFVSDGGDALISIYRDFLSRPVHFSQYFNDLGVDWSSNSQLFGEHYKRVMNSGAVKLFPDSVSALKSLNKNHKIGLVTSSYREVVLKKLGDIFKKLGADFVFDSMVCYGEAPTKPSPLGILKCLSELGVKPCESVYVGDMISDAIAASGAGVSFIGVTYGYNTRKSLESYPNIGFIDKLSDLETFIN